MDKLEPIGFDEALVENRDNRFYQRVRRIHFELTNKCNASCPQCARNYFGGPVREGLVPTELSLGDVRKMLSDEFVRGLELVYVNGNYGDGAAAADCFEIFAHLRAVNPRLYTILLTNGSLRTPPWWGKLAGVVSEIQWGIDGLADTHALYRRGTSFEKIIANASAYIAGGGKAFWVYNVFRHNEHQVEEARRRAAELGFAKFEVRKTARFEAGGKVSRKYPVLNDRFEHEYDLEIPLSAAYRNPAYDTLPEVENAYDPQWSRDADRRVLAGDVRFTPLRFPDQRIACVAKERQAIFISAFGDVYPCCWMAQNLPLSYSGSLDTRHFIESLPGGAEGLNALRRPLEEILSGPFFRGVEERWSCGNPLSRCAYHCGTRTENALVAQNKDR